MWNFSLLLGLFTCLSGWGNSVESRINHLECTLKGGHSPVVLRWQSSENYSAEIEVEGKIILLDQSNGSQTELREPNGSRPFMRVRGKQGDWFIEWNLKKQTVDVTDISQTPSYQKQHQCYTIGLKASQFHNGKVKYSKEYVLSKDNPTLFQNILGSLKTVNSTQGISGYRLPNPYWVRLVKIRGTHDPLLANELPNSHKLAMLAQEEDGKSRTRFDVHTKIYRIDGVDGQLIGSLLIQDEVVWYNDTHGDVFYLFDKDAQLVLEGNGDLLYRSW